jgi:rubrerythrin
MTSRDDAVTAVLEEIVLQLRRIALAVEKAGENHSACRRCGFSLLKGDEEKCPACRTTT